MIPLIKKLDIDEINTSLIAIRKLLNNVGITETNITNIVGKDYDAKIQELEEKVNNHTEYTMSFDWDNRGGVKQIQFSQTIPKGMYMCEFKMEIGSAISYSIGITENSAVTNPYPTVHLEATTQTSMMCYAYMMINVTSDRDTFTVCGNASYTNTDPRHFDVKLTRMW